jgi:hypothetical protein
MSLVKTLATFLYLEDPQKEEYRQASIIFTAAVSLHGETDAMTVQAILDIAGKALAGPLRGRNHHYWYSLLTLAKERIWGNLDRI